MLLNGKSSRNTNHTPPHLLTFQATNLDCICPASCLQADSSSKIC